MTGCGEIDLAEASAKIFFTAYSSLSRLARSARAHSHLPPNRPAPAPLAVFGIDLVLKDKDGKDVEGNSVSGVVCIKQPWPGSACGM